MMLDFDSAVIAFSSQPFWLYCNGGKGQRRHAPDFFARLAHGGGVVLDVRPDDRIDASAAEAFAVTAKACAEVGWEFRRTGGPPMVLAANVRWLAGYRHSRCGCEAIAAELLQVFNKPMPLLTGSREIGDPIAVLPVLYHLLWCHVHFHRRPRPVPHRVPTPSTNRPSSSGQCRPSTSCHRPWRASRLLEPTRTRSRQPRPAPRLSARR